MRNNFSDLSVVIVTYKTNLNILEKCLSSIDPSVKIIIVENSSKFINEDQVANKYKNVSIFCTGSNIGYGRGNNYGLQKVDTKYALILNPDIVCEKNYFENLKVYLNNELDFSIIGSQYLDNETYAPAGFFDSNLDLKDADQLQDLNLFKVDWVVGCSMLLNLKKFKSKSIFDENFFLFFEEFDLCKILKKNGEKVYSSSKLIVNHFGFKSSTDSTDELDLIRLRNWHYMWSYFYYHKKNEGYFKALKVSFGKLVRSLFKLILFTMTFNKKKRTNYLYRYLGLLNSIIGKKSFYRINS
jgi:GT2 family glycosyltransferase